MGENVVIPASRARECQWECWLVLGPARTETCQSCSAGGGHGPHWGSTSHHTTPQATVHSAQATAHTRAQSTLALVTWNVLFSLTNYELTKEIW